MRYLSLRYFRTPSWAIVSALFFVTSLFIQSGCSSKPKAKSSKSSVPVDLKSSRGSAPTESKPPVAEAAAPAEKASSSTAAKLNKADAKEDCKKKGLKGKELKGCMRELMSK